MKKIKKKKRTKKKTAKPFGEAEFVKALWKVMKKQEKASPAIKKLHALLSGKKP